MARDLDKFYDGATDVMEREFAEVMDDPLIKKVLTNTKASVADIERDLRETLVGMNILDSSKPLSAKFLRTSLKTEKNHLIAILNDLKIMKSKATGDFVSLQETEIFRRNVNKILNLRGAFQRKGAVEISDQVTGGLKLFAERTRDATYNAITDVTLKNRLLGANRLYSSRRKILTTLGRGRIGVKGQAGANLKKLDGPNGGELRELIDTLATTTGQDRQIINRLRINQAVLESESMWRKGTTGMTFTKFNLVSSGVGFVAGGPVGAVVGGGVSLAAGSPKFTTKVLLRLQKLGLASKFIWQLKPGDRVRFLKSAQALGTLSQVLSQDIGAEKDALANQLTRQGIDSALGGGGGRQ